MVSLLRTLLRMVFGRAPKLACSQQLWNQGVDELRRRTRGIHESGAFLLGSTKGRVRTIRQFLFYDDIDPKCFAHGIVEFDGGKFGLVWEKCRELHMEVIADVHVHPGGYDQSSSDRHNPMIAEPGHLAVILPHFAARACMPGRIGIYEYLGSRQWQNRSMAGGQIFHVGWWPK
jgi:proteasome lid subunit RPN8/RPN11